MPTFPLLANVSPANVPSWPAASMTTGCTPVTVVPKIPAMKV
jgi:hypothetical protein